MIREDTHGDAIDGVPDSLKLREEPPFDNTYRFRIAFFDLPWDIQARRRRQEFVPLGGHLKTVAKQEKVGDETILKDVAVRRGMEIAMTDLHRCLHPQHC